MNVKMTEEHMFSPLIQVHAIGILESIAVARREAVRIELLG